MPEIPGPEITVTTLINAPVTKVWEFFNEPRHIVEWNNASPLWRTPRAVNDLKVGGIFNYRMEAKDGSSGFDFNGTYTEIIPEELVAYTMEGGRKVRVTFRKVDGGTQVTTVFDSETVNPIEMQKSGWQAILENFKVYTETH